MGNLCARMQEIIGEKIFRHKVTFEGDVVFKTHITGYAPVAGEPSSGTWHDINGPLNSASLSQVTVAVLGIRLLLQWGERVVFLLVQKK